LQPTNEMILLLWMDLIRVILICLLFPQVNVLYRSTGATFDQAKQELGQSIASNRMVQETATGAARGAARSAVDGAFANSPY